MLYLNYSRVVINNFIQSNNYISLRNRIISNVSLHGDLHSRHKTLSKKEVLDKINMMSNKKPPIPQCPIVPVEEEIEEDLKTIDETEAPLLTDDAKVLLESIGTEVVKNDTQETAQKLVDNVDELEQTITALDKKYNDLMSCEKELEEIEEEIDKQIKEMTNYISEIQSNPTPAVK